MTALKIGPEPSACTAAAVDFWLGVTATEGKAGGGGEAPGGVDVKLKMTSLASSLSTGDKKARFVLVVRLAKAPETPPFAVRRMNRLVRENVPVPASTCTVPPVKVAVPVTRSLSFWPAGLMLTRKVEPGAKLALPVTLSVVKGVSAPGATVPPDCATRPPTVPEPASVPPFDTVAIEFAIDPVTARVPTVTVVGPV